MSSVTVSFSGSCALLPDAHWKSAAVLLPDGCMGWASPGGSVVSGHDGFIILADDYVDVKASPRKPDLTWLEPVPGTTDQLTLHAFILQKECIRLPDSTDIFDPNLTSAAAANYAESLHWVPRMEDICSSRTISAAYGASTFLHKLVARVEISAGHLYTKEKRDMSIFDPPKEVGAAALIQYCANEVALEFESTEADPSILSSSRPPIQLRSLDDEIHLEIGNEVLLDRLMPHRVHHRSRDNDFEVFFELLGGGGHCHVPIDCLPGGTPKGRKTDCNLARFGPVI